MTRIWKIVKIDLMALVALPLLLIAIAAKLLMKALEKSMVFLGVGAAALGLGLVQLLLRDPGGFFEGLGLMVAMLILFGAIIVLVLGVLVFFGSVAAAVVAVVVGVLMGGLELIFQFSHDGYAKLYDCCKGEYETLTAQGAGPGTAWACCLWQVLRGVSLVTVKLFALSLPLAVAASLALVGYTLVSAYRALSATFGIGMVAYLKLFPVMETVFAVLYVLIFLGGAIAVLLSLGVEWGEWGQLLKLSTVSYPEYRDRMLCQTPQATHLEEEGAFAAGADAQRCQQYLQRLNGLYEDVEELQQQVDAAMHLQQDTGVLYDFTEYLQLLEEISQKLSAYPGQIPCDQFQQRFIPMIERASRLAREVSKHTLKILERGSAGAGEMDFFGGCTTQEEIKRRYKALCKIYHPDVGGHQATFQRLHDQYEQRCAAAPV